MRNKNIEESLSQGVNDLKIWCELNNRLDLIEEWDYDLNILKPEQVSCGSHKEINWVY